MAIVNDYRCSDCGLELVDDAGAFIWDDETDQTRDFMILMLTCTWLLDAKVSGHISETYCSNCDKFVRIYSIRKVPDGIENPCELVMEGIKNHMDEYSRKLDELKNIKKRADYTIEKEDYYYVVKFQNGNSSIIQAICLAK